MKTKLFKFLSFSVLAIACVSIALLVYMELSKTTSVATAGYTCHAQVYLINGARQHPLVPEYINNKLCSAYPVVATFAGIFLILGVFAVAYLSTFKSEYEKNIRTALIIFLISIFVSIVAIVLIECFIIR
jgi:hypothetical protein